MQRDNSFANRVRGNLVPVLEGHMSLELSVRAGAWPRSRLQYALYEYRRSANRVVCTITQAKLNAIAQLPNLRPRRPASTAVQIIRKSVSNAKQKTIVRRVEKVTSEMSPTMGARGNTHDPLFLSVPPLGQALSADIAAAAHDSSPKAGLSSRPSTTASGAKGAMNWTAVSS